MKVRIYGGIREIGGNKILVSSSSRRAIILDFGKSFSREEAFFQYPFMPPSFPDDYFKVGLLPPARGSSWRVEGYDALGLLISHAHLDHWGYLRMLNSEIEVFLGKAARRIIETYRMTRRDLSGLDRLKMNCFQTGDILNLGEFSIMPIHVDHSIPGAYGFIVECCGRKLAYTGDLRMHGPKANMTRDFIDAAASEGINLLIMEATKVAPENDPESSLVKVLENRIWYRWRRSPPKRVNFEASTEEEVKEKMVELLERSNSLTLIEVAPTDVDRMRTVYEVTKKLGRKLVMDERTAFMIDRLGGLSISGLPLLGDYAVWKRRKRGRDGREIKFSSKEPKTFREFLKKIEDKRGEDFVIWGEERAKLFKDANSYVIITNNATRFLYEIPLGIKPNMDFVMSRSEPFSEESALSLDRLMNWLILYNVKRYYRIHVSGHLSPYQIKDVLDAINPSKVVPVHTEHRDLFDIFVPRRMISSILLPEVGEPLEV